MSRQCEKAVIARRKQHRGKGDVLVVYEHISEPHRRRREEERGKNPGPFADEFAAEAVERSKSPTTPKSAKTR